MDEPLPPRYKHEESIGEGAFGEVITWRRIDDAYPEQNPQPLNTVVDSTLRS